ncbi:MAG: ATP synthase F1 subunit delta [Gemmatimonadota bacterium]
MSTVTIARNYAEALFSIAEKSGQTDRYAELMDAVAGAFETSPRVHAVLLSPRVTKTQKATIVGKALGGLGVPDEFGRFLQAVIKRGRQSLFRQIASEYLALVDLKLNRVRAGVTLARPADPALQQRIADELSKMIGKQVVPLFETDPAILGGMIARVDDRVFDGSVRRRMTLLRRALLG